MAKELEVKPAQPKAEWQKPELRRLRAGSAEDASGTVMDALNPS